MGEEEKPKASFLNRRGAIGQTGQHPSLPQAGEQLPLPPTAPVPGADVAAPQGSMASVPAVPPMPAGLGAGKLSGKFKAPGNKTVFGTAPRMSAIAARGATAPGVTVSQALGPVPRSRTGIHPKVTAIQPKPSLQIKQMMPQPPVVPAPRTAPAVLPVAQGASGAVPETASGFEAPRAQAERHLQHGLDHFDRGEFEQALEEYNKAIDVDPTFSMAYNNLGMVLIDLERYDEALHALYGSIQRDQNYAEAYNNLGFVLRRLGNNLDAIAAYRIFLTLEPDVEEGSRINSWIDNVLTEHGLTEVPQLTIPESEQLQEQPEPPTAEVPPKIKKMAAWEAAAGDVATAAPINALGEIENPAPAHAPAQPGIRMTQNIPKLPVAIPPPPFLGETSEEQNLRMIALIEKSLDEFEAGNFDEARSLANQALEINPECSEAHTALGKVLVREEKYDEGIQHLERAIELDPLDPAPFYVLGFTLRALERNVEAAEIYEKFLKLMPDAADASKMRQWIMHINGLAQAEAAGDTDEDAVIDDQPLTSETDKLYKSALDRFKMVTAEETIDECERILAEAPEHVQTRLLLGRAHLRRQDFDSAGTAFAQALEYNPGSAEALYFMGQCEEKRGDSPRALKLYRSYVENHPEGPRVEKLRAWFLSHGVSETGKGLSQQIQCEWCLRFFDENEISLHENKATCNGCLTLMGSAPIQDAAKLEQVDPADEKRALRAEGGKGGGGGLIKWIALAGLGGSVAALVAVGVFTSMLDPLLAKVGINKTGKGGGTVIAQKPPIDPKDPKFTKIIPDIPDTDPDVTTPLTPDKIKPVQPKLNLTFDASKVKISNAPERDFAVFSRWSWKPELAGVAELDESAQGWKKEYSFQKDRPAGMRIEDGVVIWNTGETKDFEALMRGLKYTVGLTIKGYWVGPEGARKDLFSTSTTFSVSSQFGYELGLEMDVGLPTDARNMDLAALGGDESGRALGVLHGSQNQGGARAVIVGVDGIKRSSALTDGARCAAACEFSISEPDQNGILAANWKTGEVKMFLNKSGSYEPAASVKFPPGTMALCAIENGKGKLAVAGLSSATGMLSICEYTPATGFSSVRNVQLSGGGGSSRIVAWKSEKKGLGFLAVLPLAEDPLRFVPISEKDAGEPVRSTLKEEGVITAALPLEYAFGSRRLALVLGGKVSYVVLLEEKGGAFTTVGAKVALPGPGLGAAACDFNKDGCDDLFVTMRDEVCFLFLNGDDKLTAGPALSNPGMLGPVAVLKVRSNLRPNIAVLNENRKVRMFRPVFNEPAATTKGSTVGALERGR